MGKSTTKSSSKAAKATSSDKKQKKQVTKKEESSSSSSSSSESSSSSSSDSDSSSDSESEDEKKKETKKEESDSSSSSSDSDSSSDSESEDEKKEEAKKSESSSSDSDSDSDSSSSSSDSDSESEKDESSASSSSDNGKRKAEDSDVEMEDTSSADQSAKRQKAASSQGGSLYVGNLPFSATDETLKELFGAYGEITAARIATQSDSGRSRGFGYIDFATTEARDKAAAATGLEIEGRELRLDPTESTARQDNAGRKNPGAGREPNSTPSSVLFIGNLSFSSTEDSIREAFAECGEVTSVRIITDRDTGRMKGYGYIEFADVEAAKSAMQWNNSMLDGRSIRLDYSAPRNRESGGNRGGPRGGGRGGFRGGRGGGGFRGGSRGRY
ncbi:nuclear localization sequence binding protein [Coemansia sp. RSA 1722]|nr:nuclear localization sequence binding protein [Coemansia sp. RSA 486]KAJ2236901.1 nuclear localization sequence binding protein [Coemansia sp. RSA 485]KAJ2603829.1 nuclear localization sequence binding protein [Coemansia sp. RSA 1722]